MTASEPMGPDGEHLLDPDELQRLERELGANAPRLAATFIRVAPQRMASLEEALAEKDGLSLKRAAHTFKGTASQVGARALLKRCQGLEEIALAESWPEADAQLETIREMCDRTVAALDAWSAALGRA